MAFPAQTIKAYSDHAIACYRCWLCSQRPWQLKTTDRGAEYRSEIEIQSSGRFIREA
jgi:hypothetical protein